MRHQKIAFTREVEAIQSPFRGIKILKAFQTMTPILAQNKVQAHHPVVELAVLQSTNGDALSKLSHFFGEFHQKSPTSLKKNCFPFLVEAISFSR